MSCARLSINNLQTNVKANHSIKQPHMVLRELNTFGWERRKNRLNAYLDLKDIAFTVCRLHCGAVMACNLGRRTRCDFLPSSEYYE